MPFRSSSFSILPPTWVASLEALPRVWRKALSLVAMVIYIHRKTNATQDTSTSAKLYMCDTELDPRVGT